MGKRKSYTSQFKSKIVLEVLKEERSLVEISSKHGIHVNQLHQWRKATIDHMPQKFERENKKIDQMKEEYEDQIKIFYAEVGGFTTQLSWLKKIWTNTRTYCLDMLDWKGQSFPKGELLNLNRSSLYYRHVEPSPEEILITSI